MSNLLADARALVENGFSILPIRADGTKAPAIAEWKTLQSRIPDDEELQDWFGNGKNYGIALIAGAVSGGLEILDFDESSLFKPWGNAVKAAGSGELLKSLVIVKTPANGWHVCWRCPQQVEGNQKLAQRKNSDGKIETLIETRGEGGYVLTVGSPAECHPSGKEYALKRGQLNSIPSISAEERDLLISCARSLNEYTPAPPIYRDQDSKRDIAISGARPGDDFNSRTSWEEILMPHGWTLVRRIASGGYWRKPGATDPGHHATTTCGDSEILYVFSSSAAPFEQEQPYTKFGAYTFLNHGGDFVAATKALATLGYGTQEAVQKSAQISAEDEQQQEEILPPRLYPVLPQKALYGLAGEIAITACKHSEADPAAVLLTMLAWAGACFGSNVYVDVGDTKHYPRIYVGIVGASSKARKGTSKDPCQRIFKSLPDGLSCRVSGGPLASGEGVIFAVRDPGDKLDEAGLPTDPGVLDKRLLVIESEWAASLQATGRDSNTLSAIMRMAFDSGDIDPLTKNNRIKVSGAHVGFVGHITLEEFARLLSEVDVYNGYANRILFGCVRRQKLVPSPQPIPKKSVATFATRLDSCIQKGRNNGAINFDEETRLVWQRIYPHLTQDRSGKLGAVTARAEALVIRLSLIFALLDESTAIKAAHLEAALAVWTFCFESAKYIFGNSETDPIREKILQALAQGEMTMTAINKHFNGRGGSGVKNALEELQATGRINLREEKPAKGKKTTYLSINPDFKLLSGIDGFADLQKR